MTRGVRRGTLCRQRLKRPIYSGPLAGAFGHGQLNCTWRVASPNIYLSFRFPHEVRSPIERYITKADDRKEERQNFTVPQVMFEAALEQDGDDNGGPAVQGESYFRKISVFPCPSVEITKDATDEPQESRQSREATFSTILQKNVMQMPVEALWQWPGCAGRKIVGEL